VASAWGSSWGNAWGNSWGVVVVAIVTPPERILIVPIQTRSLLAVSEIRLAATTTEINDTISVSGGDSIPTGGVGAPMGLLLSLTYAMISSSGGSENLLFYRIAILDLQSRNADVSTETRLASASIQNRILTL
jgi:hypothetical protein